MLMMLTMYLDCQEGQRGHFWKLAESLCLRFFFTIHVFVCVCVCLWSRIVKVHARISVSWASEFQTVLRMPLV